MIPTIAASTGAALRPSASPAAFPSITTSTRSPIPAPTESMASSGPPRGAPSGPCGWTSSSFAPSSLRCFCVETTVPTTVPICIARASARVHGIDDADDRRVGGHFDGMERIGGFAPAHEEDAFADPGAGRVDGHQALADRLAVDAERLDDEQLRPGHVGVLDGRDDGADDFS